MYMFNITRVGSGPYASRWSGEQDAEEGTDPAGVGVSSIAAEAAVAERALIKVGERVSKVWRGRINPRMRGSTAVTASHLISKKANSRLAKK